MLDLFFSLHERYDDIARRIRRFPFGSDGRELPFLSAEDLALQATARAFADDLIPHEEYAEAHGGHLPDGLADQHRKRAIVDGLFATNLPVEHGGTGATSPRSWTGPKARRPATSLPP